MTGVTFRERLPYFYEGIFQSPKTYGDPLREVEVTVELVAPSGKKSVVPAFWDGGRIWRFRVDAEEPGVWRYALRTSDGTQDAWHGGRSEFQVTPYAGPNPLYRHGPLGVSKDGTHLVHRDGTPFFWLADTAWNALLKAEPAAFEWYLSKRREQGFTAVQCVMTHWRGCPADLEGEEAFEGEQQIRINPRFFRRIDGKVAAVARHGLVPALVILWALTPTDPGVSLPEEDAILLARYIVARYGAYRPVWFLGGDGIYSSDIERWRRIGRAVFGKGVREGLPVTLHPAANLWIADAVWDEPWFDFAGYQSSHGADYFKSFAWIYDGPPAKAWRRLPPKPVINLEPCYEEHLQVGSDRRFDAQHVRIASYYSLLASPVAGVTYGHAAVWPWSEQAESPLNHLGAGITSLWHTALDAPGAASMSCLKHIFEALPWWKLRPAPELVIGRQASGAPAGGDPAEQRAADAGEYAGVGAGGGAVDGGAEGDGRGKAAEDPGSAEVDPLGHIAAAMTTDQTLSVVYLPQGGEVVLDTTALEGASAVWVNPASGERLAGPKAIGGHQLYAAPARSSGGGDWLLILDNRRQE